MELMAGSHGRHPHLESSATLLLWKSNQRAIQCNQNFLKYVLGVACLLLLIK